MKPPKHIIEKALKIFKIEKQKRELMNEIEIWLNNNGYDVDLMRNNDSFQVFLETGEFENEEEVIKTIEHDLNEYKYED
jgi:hypothetical protein